MIHRWWAGPLTPPDTGAAVRSTHPGLDLLDHTFDFPDDGLVCSEDRLRHASNVIRLRLLWEHGGLWLDHDVTPHTDLTKVIRGPWTGCLGSRREGSVLWFPEPGHPWLRAALDQIEGASPSTTARCSDVSGSNMLTSLPDLDVGFERRVIPRDARGRRQPLPPGPPLASHGWFTTKTLIPKEN